MSPFQSLRDYETFVYTLQQQFPQILQSTLVVAQRGRLYAEVAGDIYFFGGHRSMFPPTSSSIGYLLLT
jgi:hypothetical protein